MGLNHNFDLDFKKLNELVSSEDELKVNKHFLRNNIDNFSYKINLEEKITGSVIRKQIKSEQKKSQE